MKKPVYLCRAAPDRFSFFGFGRKKKEVDDSTCSDDGEVQEEEEVGEYLAEPMAPEEMASVFPHV